MSRYRHLSAELLSILVPTLMAGCAVRVATAAMGFAVSPLLAYAATLLSAGVVMLAGRGSGWMIAAIFVPVAGTIATIAAGAAPLKAFLGAMQTSGETTQAIAAANSTAGVFIALLMAIIGGALTALLYRTRVGKPFALLLPIASILLSLTFAQDLSIWAALPGIAGCIAAFAENDNITHSRVNIAAVAACLCIALLGILLAPASGTSWKPLKELAEKIRTITDEYIHFTAERVAFSINEKGYDHGGMISDTVVTMLGGKAEPSEEEVMRVAVNTDLLLRGTIKQTYTGYSWVDERVKARYLYYDFTHAGTRSDIFGADSVKKNSAFQTIKASVRMTDKATSTLFVPAHMSEFSMDLADAVYYNSVGEVFLTRDVAPGDTYEVSAQVPISDELLIRSAIEAENRKDADYAMAQSEYTGLPDGISEDVYALAMSVTAGLSTNIEKAVAIRKYLATNYRYTLDAGYPEQGRDFVSWFLLEEKKGYCSYFATAMTVLCRIAGVPARYVEGYYVRGSAGESIVTGHNAHAWVEVYLSGIGWTAFDPTAAAYRTQNGLPEENTGMSPNENSGRGSGDTSNEQTPFGNSEGMANDPGESEGSNVPNDGDSPDEGSDGDNGNEDPGDDGSEDDDSGSDDSEGDSDDGEIPPDEDDGSGDNDDSGDNDESENNDDSEDKQEPEDKDEPDDKQDERPHISPWIWITIGVLVLAALIALGVMWVRKRLRDTDPLLMCKKSRNARKASMILYRAILTLLLQSGFVPMSGELPEDFAARVCQSIPNDAYMRFVAAAAKSSYSGESMKRSELEDGRDAYLAFLAGMKPMEKLRYNTRRVLNGIGDTESIP